jgi:hypothetical protein
MLPPLVTVHMVTLYQSSVSLLGSPSLLNMAMDIPTQWYDPLSLLAISQGAIIWFFMFTYLSIEAAWISFACGGIIGLFLWLTALGYQNSQVAKFTIYGILINAFLSLISAFYAFN